MIVAFGVGCSGDAFEYRLTISLSMCSLRRGLSEEMLENLFAC